MTAIDLFNQVIAKDPHHAQAYAGLANSYNLLSYYGGMPAELSYPKSREAARRALEMNEGLAEAHAALAVVYRDFDRNWEDAEREFVRAIQLDPNYGSAHQWYAEYLTALGRFDEALVHIKMAEDAAPLSLIIRTIHAWIYLEAGHAERAISLFEDTIAMDPEFPVSHWILGQACCITGDYQRAIDELELAISLSGDNSHVLADLGYVNARAGHRSEALEIRGELTKAERRGDLVSYYGLAKLDSGLGDPDAAFACLSRSLEKREMELIYLRVDPLMDPIRSDPRFDDLVRRIGLPVDQSPGR